MDVPSKQQEHLPKKVVRCAILATLLLLGSTFFYAFASMRNPSSAKVERKPGSLSQSEVADWKALRDMLIQEISSVDPNISRKLSQPSSSEWRAMQWMLTEDQTTIPLSSTIQRFAVVATFVHFSLHMTAALHECDWDGIECGGNVASGQLNAIKSLNFSKYNLAGTIPITMAYVSPSLESLDLSAHGLKGTIPSACFIQWKKLVVLNLNENRLTRFFTGASGDVPVAMLDSLEILTIANNRLDETVSRSISSWTSLKHLDMRGNAELAGQLLEYGLPYWKSIKHIEISHTKVGGTIPYDVTLPYLNTLVASNSQLSGSLPESLSTATNLRTLELGVGSSKPWTGSLPSSYSSLTAIETFALVNFAQITGTLPEEWGTAWTSVQALNLYGNQLLKGTIPLSWGEMTNLVVLRLGKTGISGSIPSEFGRLTNLFYLGLTKTQLTGTMPPEVCSLRVEHVLRDLEADCFLRSEFYEPPVACPNPECCTMCSRVSD